jgi:hypothetical protein
MRWNRPAALVLCLLTLSVAPVQAQQERDLFRLVKMHMQNGTVALGDGIATLKVGPSFGYLDRNDAETFLTRIFFQSRLTARIRAIVGDPARARERRMAFVDGRIVHAADAWLSH